MRFSHICVSVLNLVVAVLLRGSGLMFFELKIANILKSSGWGLEKSEMPWEQNFFIALCVFPVELSAYVLSLICAANWPR